MSSQTQLDYKTSILRSCITLSAKLFSTQYIDEFLSILHKATVRPFHVKSLVLCYQSGYFGPIQYICSTKEIYQRQSNALWPKTSHNIRFKDHTDRQYLANELGRPFLNILTLPIATKRFGVGNSTVLFVELSGRCTEKIKQFFDLILPTLENALDQVLLEDHLRTNALLWTSTFNSLEEPLAILDEQGNVSKSNRAFEEIFSSPPATDQLQQQTLQHKQKAYEKHNYTVSVKDSTYTIYHYSDITQSLVLRNQMIQNAKMTALGDLGESVAHQLNNPLTGVSSMIQLLLNTRNLNEDFKEDIKEIREAVKRSQKIISNLLDFANSKNQLHLCELNQVTKNTLSFLKSITHSCYLSFQPHNQPVIVQAQTCLLQQVIFNLVKNACQAVVSLKKPSAKVHIQVLSLEGMGVIRVEDSGRGIKKSNYKNIFKPFFTTKSHQTGTGLGLNVSSSIIKSFQGNLVCGRSSTLGGACFTIYLPLKTGMATKKQQPLMEKHQ